MGVLACVVVFCTTYALILPAVTLEGDAVYCGYQEHVHTGECYTRPLICGLEESGGHAHTDECYEDVQTLTCGLEEDGEHIHTGDCYEPVETLICGLEESEGHVHTEDCYGEAVLACGLEEHTHTEECRVDPAAADEDEDEDEDDASLWSSVRSSVMALFSAGNGASALSDDGDDGSVLVADSAAATAGIGADKKTADGVTAGDNTGILGGSSDGARYAGRVWSDKSVYTDSTVPIDGTEFTNSSDFLTVFSALGSSRVIADQVTTPLDVVLVLDVSLSMANESEQADSRIQHSVDQINMLIDRIMALNAQTRVGIVTFGDSAAELLPLDHYEKADGADNYLSVLSADERVGTKTYPGYTFNSTASNRKFTVKAEVKSSSSNQAQTLYVEGQNGTFTQGGLYKGMQMLSTVSDTTVTVDGEEVPRTPVVVLVSDGAAAAFSAASTTVGNGSNSTTYDTWWNFTDNSSSINTKKAARAARLLATLLTASYEKEKISAKYGMDAQVFTVGIDLGSTPYTLAYLDPENNFKTTKTDEEIQDIIEDSDISYEDALALACDAWKKYSSGDTTVNTPKLTLTAASGSTAATSYTFNHPETGDVTTVNYVDKFFQVGSSDDLAKAFAEILAEATGSAFMPTTDVTGQDSTGILYTDPIGRYMEVKEIKGVLIDGKPLKVFPDTGAVTVTDAGTTVDYYAEIPAGEKHPLYGIDIGGMRVTIKVTTDNTGMQTLRVEVPSEILPAKCQTVTISADGSTTISEQSSLPLRVIYTVGVADSIKKEDGTVDPDQVDREYLAANLADDGSGNVYFYSNYYDETNNGYGNATVEFSPSTDNRYYYFQTNRVIYKSAADQDGNPVPGQFEGVLKTVGSDGTITATGVAVSDPVTAITDLKDDTYYYMVIDYYRATDVQAKDADGDPVTDVDGKPVYEAEHVYHVVSRTGKDLKNSVELVGYDTKGLVTGGETGNGQVLATKIGAARLGRMQWFIKEKTDENGDPANLTGTSDYCYAPTYSTIADGDTPDSAAENTFKVYLGNNGRLAVPLPTLEVSKTVKNAPDSQSDNSFAFTVALTNGSDTTDGGAADRYIYTIYDVNEETGARTPASKEDGTAATGTFTGGSITIDLTGGQVAVISGLAANTGYTVTEKEPGDRWAVTASRKDAGNADDDSEDYTYRAGDTLSAAGTVKYQVKKSAEDEVLSVDGTSVVAFTNAYTFDLTVLKVDSADGSTPLSDAQFVLYFQDAGATYYYNNGTPRGWEALPDGQTESAFALTTAKEGTITLRYIPDGVYYLKELQAPAGYTLPADAVAVTVEGGKITSAIMGVSRCEVSDDGLTVTVPNTAGYELPHTGGAGTGLLYTFGGLLLTAGALMYGYRLWRKERRSHT